MKKSKIVSYTSEEVKQLPDESDWEGADAMTDEEIEAAIASDPEESAIHERWRKRARAIGYRPSFVMCIKNEGQEASLTLRKLYKVIPDSDAERLKMVRIIDDRGEDYMHPARWFVPVQLSVEAEQGFELVTA